MGFESVVPRKFHWEKIPDDEESNCPECGQQMFITRIDVAGMMGLFLESHVQGYCSKCNNQYEKVNEE